MDGADGRPATLTLEDRQLLVELQSLGVRMPESDGPAAVTPARGEAGRGRRMRCFSGCGRCR